MGKYLLFGGSGFIGHHLRNAISGQFGDKWMVFDIENEKEESPAATFERIDVRNPITTQYKPTSEDVIFNLAAVHRTPGHREEEYFETNILGAEHVCDYARKNNINTIVFTSSIAVYGIYEDQKSEKTIPRPDIPYGISKLTAEYIHRLWQKEDPKKRRLIIVRPGVVFGKYERGNFTRLINAIAAKRFFYPGRKDTVKACIYVKDLVHAMQKMVALEKMGVEIYNMTYNPAPGIDKICDVIGKQGAMRPPKIVLPSWFLNAVSRVLYAVFRKPELHPDRVKKLTISNAISGRKLDESYDLIFGLENGIADWMLETKFKDTKKIY